jgi:hypothetical protein
VAIFAGGDNNRVLVERTTISAAGFSGIAVRDTLGAAPTNVDTVENDVRNAFKPRHRRDRHRGRRGRGLRNTVRKSHQDGLNCGWAGRRPAHPAPGRETVGLVPMPSG